MNLAILHSQQEAILSFRQALDHAGFSEKGLGEALGKDATRLQLDLDVPLYERRLGIATPRNTLFKLFVLHAPVDEVQARAALAPASLAGLAALGLIERTGNQVRARVRISLCDGLLLAHDFMPHGQESVMLPDHVLGLNPAALTLARLSVRRPAELALDLGTGCGVQALLAARHCRRVIAVDVNPRALYYAAFNAALNGFDNIECRLGSWFEPVAGLSFDLIVCNPPYVISPDSQFQYRDSGLVGDGMCEQVVRSAPAYLSEGGFACVLCNWAHRQAEDWSARLRPWVEKSGCDTCLLHGASQDPLAYAAAWTRTRDTAAYRAALDRWLAYYQKLGIEAISAGAVVLRRRAAVANWWRAAALPATISECCSKHLLRLFAAEDFLAAHPTEALLMAQRFQLVADHRLTQTSAMENGGFIVREMNLELTGGLRFQGSVDRGTLLLLSQCTGRQRLEAAVQAMVKSGPGEPAEIRAELAATVRRLIGHCFLTPVEGVATSGSVPPGGGEGTRVESTTKR